MAAHDPSHPLADLIRAAARGEFPPVDGGWRRVPPWRPGLEGVIAFTGHAVFAVAPDITDDRIAGLGPDGFGGAHDPRLVSALAGPDGWIDSLDQLLVRHGAGRTGTQPQLVHRPDLVRHPRARLAAALRDDVTVLGHPGRDRAAVAVLGRGVGGLLELSFEVEPDHRGGAGTALIAAALDAVPAEQLVVACAAAGNAASLRALLSAGFVPIGSLQLFRRA
jgi:hypothetical protein